MGGSLTMNMLLLRCLCIISCLVMMSQGRSLIDEQFHDGQSSNAAEKVKLYLYYESLCPYSARFIVNGLAPIFKNGLIDIVDLQLFPWGNAKLKSDKSFVCQHGVDECLLNTVEACAIDAWPKLDEHFPYINCVESLAVYGKYREWETCFGKYSKTVKECSSSEKGNKLELKYAAETNALKPPHTYVPWVVVNGQPLYEHGPSECLLNEIDACALDVWPTLGPHFPFIYCVESLVYEGKYKQWESCFEKLELDSKPVTDCYSSGYGREIVLKYGAVTDALEP